MAKRGCPILRLVDVAFYLEDKYQSVGLDSTISSQWGWRVQLILSLGRLINVGRR